MDPVRRYMGGRVADYIITHKDNRTLQDRVKEAVDNKGEIDREFWTFRNVMLTICTFGRHYLQNYQKKMEKANNRITLIKKEVLRLASKGVNNLKPKEMRCFHQCHTALKRLRQAESDCKTMGGSFNLGAEFDTNFAKIVPDGSINTQAIDQCLAVLKRAEDDSDFVASAAQAGSFQTEDQKDVTRKSLAILQMEQALKALKKEASRGGDEVDLSDIPDDSEYKMNFAVETIFHRSAVEDESLWGQFAESVDDLLSKVCAETHWKGGKIRKLSSYQQLVKYTNDMLNCVKEGTEPSTQIISSAEASFQQLLSDLKIENDEKFKSEKDKCQGHFGIGQ